MALDAVKTRAQDAVTQGIASQDIIASLGKGMQVVGERFASGEYFLSELIWAGQIMKEAMEIIGPTLTATGTASQGKIVFATVEGDLHDIGKNIAISMLQSAGFEVIDLGINVKGEDFLKAVRQHNPDVLAMSALLTTTSMEQKNVIEGLKEADLRDSVKVIVGGSPINQEFADSIGADGYGATAPEGVKLVKRFLNIG